MGGVALVGAGGAERCSGAARRRRPRGGGTTAAAGRSPRTAPTAGGCRPAPCPRGRSGPGARSAVRRSGGTGRAGGRSSGSSSSHQSKPSKSRITWSARSWGRNPSPVRSPTRTRTDSPSAVWTANGTDGSSSGGPSPKPTGLYSGGGPSGRRLELHAQVGHRHGVRRHDPHRLHDQHAAGRCARPGPAPSRTVSRFGIGWTRSSGSSRMNSSDSTTGMGPLSSERAGLPMNVPTLRT